MNSVFETICSGLLRFAPKIGGAAPAAVIEAPVKALERAGAV